MHADSCTLLNLNQNLAILRSVLFLPTEKLVMYPGSFPLGYEEQDYETHEEFHNLSSMIHAVIRHQVP